MTEYSAELGRLVAFYYMFGDSSRENASKIASHGTIGLGMLVSRLAREGIEARPSVYHVWTEDALDPTGWITDRGVPRVDGIAEVAFELGADGMSFLAETLFGSSRPERLVAAAAVVALLSNHDASDNLCSADYVGRLRRFLETTEDNDLQGVVTACLAMAGEPQESTSFANVARTEGVPLEDLAVRVVRGTLWTLLCGSGAEIEVRREIQDALLTVMIRLWEVQSVEAEPNNRDEVCGLIADPANYPETRDGVRQLLRDLGSRFPEIAAAADDLLQTLFSDTDSMPSDHGMGCASCHEAAQAGAAFCPQCGRAVPRRFCEACGSGLGVAARFCAKCGSHVVGS